MVSPPCLVTSILTAFNKKGIDLAYSFSMSRTQPWREMIANLSSSDQISLSFNIAVDKYLLQLSKWLSSHQCFANLQQISHFVSIGRFYFFKSSCNLASYDSLAYYSRWALSLLVLNYRITTICYQFAVKVKLFVFFFTLGSPSLKLSYSLYQLWKEWLRLLPSSSSIVEIFWIWGFMRLSRSRWEESFSRGRCPMFLGVRRGTILGSV